MSQNGHHLWSIDALIEAMDARPVGTMPCGIGGISIDTRSLEEGDAFFAITGDNTDGHNYLTAATGAGAALAVVSEEKLSGLGNISLPLLVVADVLVALEALGIASRVRSKAKIIAVTGSVGKTTTKEVLRHVLVESGKVHASVASFNNHWGVPVTLARMPQDTDFGIFEIGMNHPGEITPLVKMVRPHIAIITIIAAAHLGAFSGLEEIAHAKAEIFDGLVEGGTAILNRDDAHFGLLAELAATAGVSNITGFGKNEAAQARLLNAHFHPSCTCMTANILGDELTTKIGAPGRHIAQNCLAVLAAVKLSGADLAKSSIALAGLEAEKGRGQRHKLHHPQGDFVLIDESYNANPASMKAAIEMLQATAVEGRGRRIAVLGDMLELGEFSKELHQELARSLVEAKIDQVYLAGPEMKALYDVLPSSLRTAYGEDADSIQPDLVSGIRAGDALMIKASNGLRFAGLVSAIVNAYGGGEEAADQTIKTAGDGRREIA